MNIVKMKTSRFWKGEAAVQAQIEDQGRICNTTIYIKNGQVRDYSCTCAEGNSYRGICPHGDALFAYYNESAAGEAQTAVYTSAAVHTLVREYTNRQIAKLAAGREEGRLRLVPVLRLENGQVRLTFKLGADRLYAVNDLSAFCEAVETGREAEYARGHAVCHCREAFAPGCRPLLSLLLRAAEGQKPGRELELNRENRDRFLEIMEGQQLETHLPGGEPAHLFVTHGEPRLALKAEGLGQGGIRVTLEGILREENEAPAAVRAVFSGISGCYLAAGERLYCAGGAFAAAAGGFLTRMLKEAGQSVTVAARDIPLFDRRVLEELRPYSRICEKQVRLETYRPEPLRARFLFGMEEGELWMEPWLSYGNVSFRPLEEETLPRTICRDVPAEFQIGQVIRTYFRFRDEEKRRLVIREDEEALFRLLDRGIEEFRSLGEVVLPEDQAVWQVAPSPDVRVSVSGAGAGGGWLSLEVDAGDLGGQETERILAAYRQKKPYYRRKNGQFLRLGEGGLAVVSQLAGELGITKKTLQSGSIRLPACRALYLDALMKRSRGIRLFRDELFQAVVRGIGSAKESEYPVPDQLQAVLREYQKTGFRWMKTLAHFGFGGILADDMGLGKTLQVIALLEDAREHTEPGKTPLSIVICPSSLICNWEQEFLRFAPQLPVLAVVGSSAEREKLLAEVREEPGRYQVLITSYDLLRRDASVYEELAFQFQIIDEAQYIKNPATRNARAVKSLQAASRFALTGTPVENRLEELWSIFDYLMPGFLLSQSHFRKTYETPIAREEDRQALTRLRQLTAPFVLRRVKKEVLQELPEKEEQVVYAALGEEQRRLYTAKALLLREQLEREDGSGAQKLQILTELLRLRQICCDPRLCYENYRGGSAKLETFANLVCRAVEGEHRLLVFSQFTSMLALLGGRLEREGIAFLTLTGETPRQERTELVNAFQQGKAPVFLISLKAGGTGLNLTAADMVIHYDPWWNAAVQNQATDRAHRIGQEKKVTVYRLIARGTIEENIMVLQEAKRSLADQVVREGGLSLSSLTREELLQALF